MKEILLMEEKMEKEFKQWEMEQHMMVIGKMECKMVMVQKP